MLKQKLSSVKVPLFLLIGAVILAAPIIVHLMFCKVQFNQFLIHRIDWQYKTLSLHDLYRATRTTYSSGLNILFGNPKSEVPKFSDDPKAIAAYIFSWIPFKSVVYPTEGFYYYVAQLKDRAVSGNFRLADLDKGEISFAFFTIDDGEESRTVIDHLYVRDDDVKVKKYSDNLYDVTFNGKTVQFEISRRAEKAPQKTALLPEERFVGQVHDESGVRFFLLYNQETTSFYYLLNDEDGHADRFEKRGDDLLVASRTGFVYYDDKDYGRKILTAVPYAHIATNNFFDGPGDQVPYRADIRDMLHVAYPNSRFDAGIDAHGVIQGRQSWARVAITPYVRYSKLSIMEQKLDSCEAKYPAESSRSLFWSCITKEFWNRPFYRKFAKKRLADEGKDVSDVIVYQFPTSEEEKMSDEAQVEALKLEGNPTDIYEQRRLERERFKKRRLLQFDMQRMKNVQEKVREMKRAGKIPG